MTEHGWPAGVATGVGSMPGADPVEALATVFGEVPDLPYLPELPDRGAGAELIGRGAGLLVDLPVELAVGRWRLVARPGRDARRTADLLERDLDMLTRRTDGYVGPLKIQVAGPWTLAAALELPRGEAILADPGAVRDLTGSLAEGIARHVRDVLRRVPGAQLVVQLDEPGLPAVLAGRIATASGYRTHPAVEAPVAGGVLRAVTSSAADAVRRVAGEVPAPIVVHCCAAEVPLRLLRAAGATAVSLDVHQLDPDDPTGLDALGEVLDAGFGLFAGCVDPRKPSEPADTVAPVLQLWRRLGLPTVRLADQVVVTPNCGLAGVSPQLARTAHERAVAGAKVLRDRSEE
jgi:methionine synthase II (cobalamin-independent)